MRVTILPGTEIDMAAAEAAVQQATLEGMRAGVSFVVNEAKRSVARGPKTGRIYTTRFFTGKNGNVVPYGQRPPHQASAPGEPPATDTGILVNSIAGDAEISGGVVQGIVRAKAAYAAWLELGTRRMAARPFLMPAVYANRERVMLYVREAFRRGQSRFVRR